MRRTQLTITVLTVLLLLTTTNYTTVLTQHLLIQAYSPSEEQNTWYNYGFVSVQPNQTATNIHYWTGLTLADGNYTLRWQQHVNLTIRVTHVLLVASIVRAYYNFSVNIHSNIATVSNTSWQTIVSMNGSVTAPAPTGVSNILVDYPITDGLPGFFLDDSTLSTITVGSNIDIGGSHWNTVEYATFIVSGAEQLCYKLFNSSATADTYQETTFTIDHDVGIYYKANDTRLLSIGPIEQSLTYYYQVLSTNISPNPLPSPLPIIIIAGIAAVVFIIVTILLIRILWLRRNR